MNKFALVDKSKHRWDFEIVGDHVKIGVPHIRVEYTTDALDFNPKTEFEGDQAAWIEWATDELMAADVVVYDEDYGLLTHEQLEEAQQEDRWEAEHRRQESSSFRFI